MRFSVPRIKYPIERISNIALPFSLTMAMIGYVLLFTLVTLFGVYCELGGIRVSGLDMLNLAVCAGAIPVLAAFTIMSNKRWSFWLITLTVITNIMVGYSLIRILYLSDEMVKIVYSVSCFITVLNVGILCTPSVRVYYLRIEGKIVPQELLDKVKQSDRQSSWHLSTETSATILEVMMILVALFVFSMIFTGMSS